MSTRGIICIQKDNEYKIATYNHFDSYPDGLGCEILEIVKDKIKLENIRMNIDFVKKLTEEDINNKLYELAGGENKYNALDYLEKLTYRDKVENEFHPLYNNILEEIANGYNGYITYNITFAADSLFCEWGYVIDLDKNTFEVYKGFNKTKLDKNDRFFSLTEISKGEYEPIKLVAKFSLDTLPSIDDYLKICYDEHSIFLDEEKKIEGDSDKNKYIIKLEDNIVEKIPYSENILEEIFNKTYYYAINNIGSNVRVFFNDNIILSTKL